jgi:hypothetical protein
MVIGNNVLTAIGLFSTCGLMILGLLATYPAVKAYTKGHSFAAWYIFGVLLLPVAVVASLCIREAGRKQKQS